MRRAARRLSDAVRQTLKSNWQTAAVLVLTAAVGRWIAGPTFGYALFAVVWTPIAAIAVANLTRTIDRAAAGGGLLAGFFAIPWWFDESAAAAGRMTLVLAASVLMAVAVARLAGQITRSRSGGGAIAVGLWLTWLTVPVMRPNALSTVIGPDRMANLLDVNPVLTLNAASATAGDWTHQALAYRWLTRLGQDVAIDPPGSIVACVGLHGGVAVTIFAVTAVRRRRIVPRGTITSKTSSSRIE